MSCMTSWSSYSRRVGFLHLANENLKYYYLPHIQLPHPVTFYNTGKDNEKWQHFGIKQKRFLIYFLIEPFQQMDIFMLTF